MRCQKNRKLAPGGGLIQDGISPISDMLQCSTDATEQHSCFLLIPEHLNSQAARVGHVKLAVHSSTNVRSDAEGAGKTCFTSYSSLSAEAFLTLHLLNSSWHTCQMKNTALQHVTAASGLMTVCQSEAGGKRFLKKW